MQELIEVMRKRLILSNEGWRFPSDIIGGVRYYRAISPDGWVSLIDFEGTSEDWAIEKAWGKYCDLQASKNLIGDWLKEHAENAGLVYDKIDNVYIASLVVKKEAPKEAAGVSPSEAIIHWKALHDTKPSPEKEP